MSPEQDKIYTLSADNLEQAKTSPHLEGFKARNIDVLLMSDPVDEFWMQAVNEFDGKAFSSVTRGNIDLDNISAAKDEDKDGTIDDDKTEVFSGLLAKIKAELGDAVKEVRLSKTLTDSAACLVADENGMDMQMERLMKAHNKDFTGAPRILEINPDHNLILSLNQQTDKGDPQFLSDATNLLFDQAQILEGRHPENLTEFSRRMTRVMERGITV